MPAVRAGLAAHDVAWITVRPELAAAAGGKNIISIGIISRGGTVDLSTRERARPQVLGISVDAFTMTQAVTQCTDAMESGRYLSIGVVNAAKIVAMRQDPRLRQAVTGCEMILADGQSVVWASRMLGAPLPERVAGIDLFQQ